jgi:hypothetical protein
MKPNFALTLTFDTISLSRRTARGWMILGEVATSSADLPEALSYLRSKALGLSPQGFTTKLILPNSEVLYTEVTAEGPPRKQQARVRTALDGLTPYAVDELVFDTQGDGPMLQVAVVARETLEQAEDFAVQHRFNPVSFVAVPQGGAFRGEAFFGQTKAAGGLIAPGETVERDAEATVATPLPAMPDAPTLADAATAGTAVTEADVAGKVVPDKAPPVPARSPDRNQAEVAKAESVPEAPPEAASAPVDDAPVAVATAGTAPDALPTPDGATPAVEQAATAPAKPAAPGTAPDLRPVDTQRNPGATDSMQSPAFAPKAARVAETSEGAASVAAPGPDDAVAAPPVQAAPKHAPPGDLRAAAPADTPKPPVAEGAPVPPAPPASAAPGPAPKAPPLMADPAPPAFSSRRRDDRRDPGFRVPPPVTAPPVVAPPVVAPPEPVAPLTPTTASEVASPARPGPVAKPSAPEIPAAPAGPTRTVQAVGAPPPLNAPPPPLSAPPPPLNNRPPPLRQAEPAPLAKAAAPPRTTKPAVPALPKARAMMGLVTAAGLPGKGQKARPLSNAADPRQEVAAPPSGGPRSLTRGTERPRGKPRYLGLVLTGTLLILLALVAAWSSLYLSRNGDDEAEPTRVAVSEPVPGDAALPVAPAPLEVTAGDRVALPPAPDALPDTVANPLTTTMADPVEDTAATDDAAAVAASEALPEPAPVSAAPLTETAGRGDPLAIPESGGQDEIFLSTLDAPPPSFDAIALPPVVMAPDAPPAPPMAPPPFGTTYSFDADGRIAAGERGVVTPDGVWLIAARPPVIPPARPVPPVAATPAPDPGANPAVAAATGAATLFPPSDQTAPAPEAVSAFQPDTAPITRRPPARPANLIPPEPEPASETQAEDDAALTSATDPRLASLRPRARSADVLVQGDAARQAAAGASLVQAAAVSPATPTAFAGASPMAVPISRRPAPRPRDFSRAVAAAVAAATAPAPTPAAASTTQRSAPAAEPDEEDEPELTAAAAAPRIPTRADVARQATFANAINLSKINLIGIYGTSSNRYALVRTANGRYNKIKVGDRVDGGTVAAITASEVRYQKSGRMLSLQMPRG